MNVHSRWTLVGICCVIVCGWSEAAGGRLRGSVELPCVLRQWRPIEELLVYWQRVVDDKEEVVAAAVHGKVDTDRQHVKFRGRASMDPSGLVNGNFTLRLSRLQCEDSGTYRCLVFWDKSSVEDELNNSTQLQVTAEYSPPVITSAMSKEGRPQLTCNTQGGAPQPDITWINASDGTPIRHGQIHHNIDQDEDFINATSTITINVTSTTNVSCVIVTASGNLTSEPYVLERNWKPETERHHDVAPAVRNSVIVVVVLTITALLGMIVLKRRLLCARCSAPAEYQQGEAEYQQGEAEEVVEQIYELQQKGNVI